MAAVKTPLLIDMWSDFVCPFCYIGKRKLEVALKELGFTVRDAPFNAPANTLIDKNSTEKVALIRYRAFELDPNSEKVNKASIAEHLSRKYGMPEAAAIANLEGMAREAKKPGVELDFNYKQIKISNTFDAHRLLHFAQEPEQTAKYGNTIGSAVKERLLKAYFTDGMALGDEATLQRLAVELGMDGTEVAKVLEDKKAYADAVRADEAQARRMNINGVPYFWLNESVAISGAQAPEQMKAQILKAMGK